jgi:hypothetical protein
MGLPSTTDLVVLPREFTYYAYWYPLHSHWIVSSSILEQPVDHESISDKRTRAAVNIQQAWRARRTTAEYTTVQPQLDDSPAAAL